jgi:ribosomal protein S6--L-glutamate ligase
MERHGKKDFRANVSLGGSGKLVTLSEQDQAICVKASQLLGLDFSGVDIMKDKKGNTYVIEVNGNPGTKIIGITEHNYFVDLIQMIEKKVNSGKVNQNRSIEDKDTSGGLINGVIKKVTNLIKPVSQDEEYLSSTDIEARAAYNRGRGI